MTDYEADYVKRLVAHIAEILAYEDSSLAHDKDRLILSCIFLRNHIECVLGELDYTAEKEEG